MMNYYNDNAKLQTGQPVVMVKILVGMVDLINSVIGRIYGRRGASCLRVF
jgi:hypothetical protein